MADPLDSVIAGQTSPFVVSAATCNAVLGAARQVARDGRAPRGAGRSDTDAYPPAVYVLVKNTTGGSLLRRSILAPSGVVVDPAAKPIDAADAPALLVSAPVTADDPVLVAAEPIPNGGIGYAVAAGVTVADVSVSDTAHTHAVPDPGNLFNLVSAESGPVRLLQTFGSTGTKTCYVLLQGDVGAGGGGGGSSPLTTKGDLYTYGSADARLPVGTTDDDLLQPRTAEATGLKWITPPTTTTTTAVNSDPASQIRQYADATAKTAASDPHHFQQVADDGDGAGTPTVYQAAYPSGTGTAAPWAQTITPTVYQQTFAPNAATNPAYRSATESGGQVVFHVGNSARTNGYFEKPTLSSGNVTQFVQEVKVYDSGGAAVRTAAITHTATGTGVTTTYAAGFTVDFSGVASLKAPAGVQVGGNALTLAGALTTSGGHALTLATTGTTNLTLPTSGTVLSTGSTGTAFFAWVLLGTVTHADLTAAASSQDVTVATLAAKTTHREFFVRTKTVASGGGVTTLQMQVLYDGAPAGFSGEGIDPNNIDTFYIHTGRPVRSWTAGTDVGISFVFCDVDLNTLTGGEWELWALLATIP